MKRIGEEIVRRMHVATDFLEKTPPSCLEMKAFRRKMAKHAACSFNRYLKKNHFCI